MGRPKSDEPKQVVTLRLRASQIAALEALGPKGWRANLDALIECRTMPGELVITPSGPTMKVGDTYTIGDEPPRRVIAVLPAPRPHINRLKGVWKPK